MRRLSHHRKSLMGRVLSTNLVVAGVSVISLSALFLVGYHAEFERQQSSRAQMLAQFVARQSEVSALVGDREAIEKIVAGALATEDVLLVSIRYRGSPQDVLITRGKSGPVRAKQSFLAPNSWIEATEDIRPVKSGLLDWDESSSTQPETLGDVRLRMSLEKQEALFRRTAIKSVLVVAVLLVLIVLLQFFRMRKLLRPLESLIAFTRRVGSGDLRERAPIDQVDEIADVAVAFNQMLDRLGQTTVSRDYVDNIIHSMAECLIVVGNNGRIQTVNEATLMLLGYGEPDLVGQPVSMVGGDHAFSMMRNVSSVESIWRTKNSVCLTVLLSSSALRGKERGQEDFVWLAQDITDRKRIQEELVAARERYALAVAGANDGIWDWSVVSEEVYYSPRWKSMLGYEILGSDDPETLDNLDTWLGLLHPEDRTRVSNELKAHQTGESAAFESEHRMRHHDGSYRWMLSRGLAVRGSDGAATRIAGSQTDITQNKVSDPLTGLPNRVLFTDRLNRAFEMRRRNPEHRFAVLFLDLDRFKMVNDSLGHLAGDQLLLGIAQRLRDGVAAEAQPAEYTVARLSGDEFAILIEGELAPDAARAASRIGARLLHDLSKPFIIDSREVFTSASIGVALDTGGYTVPADILRDADTAMYRAKALGKSRCELFDAEMRAQAVTRLELDTDLRKAVERGEFTVYYQPKFSIPNEGLEGFEALVRWHHPTRGLVPPIEFIPAAEETGLIVNIGDFVLRQACRQMRKWQMLHPDKRLRLSVNVSPRQFAEPGLLKLVAEVLADSELLPGTLYLEVTESVLIGDAEMAIEKLNALKRLGVGLKIDDFGTGYSSLNYLHRFPFDTVKIDKSFVDNLESEEGSAIIRAIISLAKDLGMEVTAEGVATEKQMRLLASLGCRHGQGYHFSRPVPADQADLLFSRPVPAENPITAGLTESQTSLIALNKALSPASEFEKSVDS